MPLTNVGRNEIASLITGAGTVFDETNSRIGVGDDGTTAFAVTQTDLQATTNKLRKVVDSAPVVTANAVEFVATFGTSDANWDWEEWGVFNAASGGMLTRKVESLGTKADTQTWVVTATLTVTIS